MIKYEWEKIATEKDIKDTYNGFNFDYSAETGLLTITMIDKAGNETKKTVTIFSDTDKYVTSVVYEETSKQFVFTFNNGDTITCPFNVNLDDYPTNNQVDEKINNAKEYVDNAIANLTAAGVGGNGKYIKSISEANGVIFAVEETMDITPTNGSDKAITSGGVKKYVDETLENYAKKDGYYETFGYAREAGIAKNLQNDEGKLLDPDVTTSGGTVYADQPFTQRATAMTMKAYLDNELITVGSGYEQWRKEQAFSIVRNQLLSNVISTTTSSGITFTKVDNYTLTISGIVTKRVSERMHTHIIPVVPGHKYLICGMEKNNQNIGLIFNGYKDNYNTYITTYSGRDIGDGIIINNSNTNVNSLSVELAIDNGTELSKTYTVKPKVIDLTQWFASRPAIAEALNGDAGVKWFLQNYPQALTLGYDEGTIVDTEDYDYETTGVNLWDEEWELGYYNADGVKENDENTIRSKNYIQVFPNTSYYCKTNAPRGLIVRLYDENKKYLSTIASIKNTTFITPLNCFFITFCTFSSDSIKTYKNDIQISQHFTETSVEQTYHKYEIFKDRVSWAFTSTGKGKSAGSVADTKDYVNKKNIEKVGQVDLGTLKWDVFESGGNLLFTSVVTNKSSKGLMLCSKYSFEGYDYDGTIASSPKDKTIWGYVLNSNAIRVKDSSFTNATDFKNAMSGVILNYELATPVITDMSGDELDTNIPENDYGVERKVPVSGNMFSGSATTIFYQDNPLRQIYNNKSSIDKLQEEISNETTKRSDTDTALQNAIGGTLRQCLCVKESLDFDNTDFVDLGTIVLDTSITSVDGLYRFTSTTLVGVAKGSSSNTTIAKCLCTKIKTNSIDNTYLCQTGIAISPSGSISIFVQGINNNNDMKKYLKGQLLAYEKASS